MIEEWRDVKGFKGYYQVSNFGNIKSLDRTHKTPYLRYATITHTRGMVLNPYVDKDGYLVVNLKNGATVKTKRVHRIVAEAFIQNPFNKKFVDHINCNRKDNRVENLRWVTSKENQNNPLTRLHLSKAKTGANHPLYGKHLSKEHARKIGDAGRNGKCSIPIVQLDLRGNFIKEYPSIAEAHRQLRLSYGTIWVAIRKNRKSGGFKWMYKKDYEQIQQMELEIERNSHQI